MKHTIFTVLSPASLEVALEELTSHGLQHSYLIEDPEGLHIGGFFDALPKGLTHTQLIESSEGINWDEQWKQHSPYYKEGVIEINLNAFGTRVQDPIIYLEPGPGFGDLSHSTTHMMLQRMAPHVAGRHVIDIGCGSGILSLAAHKMGAKSVLGVDIDPLALQHARENALFNHMPQIEFSDNIHKSVIMSDLLILINMTLKEQQGVFECYPFLKGDFVTSGILEAQITPYLSLFPYNHTHSTYMTLDGWVCFNLSN